MLRSESTTAGPEAYTVDRERLCSCGARSVKCGRERRDDPILGFWEEGGWVVDLGKEGIGAVVDHCSDMREAFCTI